VSNYGNYDGSNPRFDAALRGALHYEGRACRVCGATTKYTSTSQCVPCTKRKTKEHREHVRALLRTAKEANPDA
jgi:hypothetical protein